MPSTLDSTSPIGPDMALLLCQTEGLQRISGRGSAGSCSGSVIALHEEGSLFLIRLSHEAAAQVLASVLLRAITSAIIPKFSGLSQ